MQYKLEATKCFFYKTVYISTESKKIGLDRDLNPGPLAPKARIIPLDHQASLFNGKQSYLRSVLENQDSGYRPDFSCRINASCEVIRELAFQQVQMIKVPN